MKTFYLSGYTENRLNNLSAVEIIKDEPLLFSDSSFICNPKVYILKFLLLLLLLLCSFIKYDCNNGYDSKDSYYYRNLG